MQEILIAKLKTGETTRVTVEAAAESTVFLGGKQQGWTDADGKLVLELREGEHVVMVTHPDLLMQSERFTVSAGQPWTRRVRGLAGNALGKSWHPRAVRFCHRFEPSAFRAFSRVSPFQAFDPGLFYDPAPNAPNFLQP